MKAGADMSVLDSPEKRKNAIVSLKDIQDALNREDIAVEDLQFFVDGDGSFYVSDPLRVYQNLMLAGL